MPMHVFFFFTISSAVHLITEPLVVKKE